MSQQHLRAAALYFLDGLDQAAVAREMGLSRSSVSRLLQQARARGLVALQPRIPGTSTPGLAALLAEQYGLRDVLLVEGARRAIGEVAAQYLQIALRPQVTIGISWGTADLIAALDPTPVRGSRVVQLAGGVAQPPVPVHLNELVQVLSAKISAEAHYLYAPAIPSSLRAAAAIRAEPSVAQTLAIGAQANVALFGIGDLEPGADVLDTLPLSDADRDELHAHAAVGTACARFFAPDGSSASTNLDRRTIGIRLTDLARVPLRIGIAVEDRKRAAVLGAIHGGLLNVLVCSRALGVALLGD